MRRLTSRYAPFSSHPCPCPFIRRALVLTAHPKFKYGALLEFTTPLHCKALRAILVGDCVRLAVDESPRQHTAGFQTRLLTLNLLFPTAAAAVHTTQGRRPRAGGLAGVRGLRAGNEPFLPGGLVASRGGITRMHASSQGSRHIGGVAGNTSEGVWGVL